MLSPSIPPPARWAHPWPRLLEALGRATVRRPWHFVVAALLSFVPALLLASRLKLESSFIELLSPADPEVRDLEQVLDKTGALGFSTIAIGAADRRRAEALAVELQRRLEPLDGVEFVEARIDVDFIEKRSLYYLSVDELADLVRSVEESIDHRIADRAGLLIDDTPPPPLPLDRLDGEAAERAIGLEPFVVGNDGKYLYVFVALAGSVGDLDSTVASQAELERMALATRDEVFPGAELLFTGPVVNRRDDAKYLGEDLMRAGTLGFAGVVLIVLAATRRKRPMLLLSMPLALGLSWTFAFAYLAVGQLNIVSGFLVSILSGLGIEYGIHLYKRYAEERRHGRDPDAATQRMLRSTGRALLSACLVNAAVFAVVAVAGFRGFMEFGLIASAGMVLTMAATLVLFPALNLLVDRRFPVHEGPARKMAPIFVRAPVRLAVIVAVPLLALYSAYAFWSGKVRFHTDWRALGSDTPTSRLDAYVMKTLPASTTQVLLYLEDAATVGAARDAVGEVCKKRRDRGLPCNLVRIVGADDLVPRDQPRKAELLSRLGAQLARIKPGWLEEDEEPKLARGKELAGARPFTAEEVPKSLTQRFQVRDGAGSMAVIVTDAVLEESTKLIDWADQVGELRAALDARSVKGALASENAVAGNIFRLVRQSGGRILAAAFAVVLVVLVLEFRRLGHALAVASSVAAGMLLVAGGMAVFDIELNFMNAAVLPIIVGVSLDNAIHIFHRYVEGGPTSIPHVLRRTGSAALLSSATNAAGFAALFVARHGGLVSVAELSVLGIAVTVFTTTVVFPIVLDFIGRLRGLVSDDQAPASSAGQRPAE
jgi:predicted RND superfamily exporter protein